MPATRDSQRKDRLAVSKSTVDTKARPKKAAPVIDEETRVRRTQVIIKDAYYRLCAGQPASERIFSPPLRVILDLPAFHALLNRRQDVTDQDCIHAMTEEDIPTFFTTWRQQKTADGMDLIRDSEFSAISPEIIIFECLMCHGLPIVGIDGFVVHECAAATADSSWFSQWNSQHGSNVPSLSIDTDGTKCAVGLTRLARMNPENITSTQLDRYKFTRKVEDDFEEDFYSREVYTWRQAVAYTMRRRSLRWKLFTTADERKYTDPLAMIHNILPQWSCMHCAEFPPQMEGRSRTIAHLKEVHKISNPQVNIDLCHEVHRIPSSEAFWTPSKRQLSWESCPQAFPPFG